MSKHLITREAARLKCSAIRVSLSASGIDPGKQDKLLELHSENKDLASEVKTLSDKLAKAKDVRRLDHIPALSS